MCTSTSACRLGVHHALRWLHTLTVDRCPPSIRRQTSTWLVCHRPVCGLFFTDLYVACFSQTCMWLVCHRVPLATQKTRQLPAPEAGWITGLYTCLVLVGHGLRRKRERLEKWVTSALRHTRHQHTGACSVAVSFLFLLSFIRHCTCFLFA